MAIQILVTTATSETPPTSSPRLKNLRSLGVWLKLASDIFSSDRNSNYITKIINFLQWTVSFPHLLYDKEVVGETESCNCDAMFFTEHGTER